jgi:predicted amidohydrolase
MNVSCVQFDMTWENKPANFERVTSMLRDANPPRGSLVLLPEMFATGFSMNVAAIAEEPGGETDQFLSATARELGIYLGAGVVTRGTDGRGRNECVFFSPVGAEIGRYCKMQPFVLGGESKSYAAGESGIVLQCGEITVAPFICYDLRFPEVTRQIASLRPQLITFIASWPNARLHHWVRLLQARAIENQCYVAGVNRIGNDPKYQHSGRSLIVDPHGEIIADAGSAEKIISAKLDLNWLATYRHDFPALQDIRADCIAGLRK